MIYKDIKSDLEFYPPMRERKNKNLYIASKVNKKYQTSISKEQFVEIVGEILNLDRGWRYVLQKNPKLRGSDYGDKKGLEREKQRELGYRVMPD